MTIDDDIERFHREVDDALKHFERFRRIILYFIAPIAIIEIVYGAMFCDFIILAIGTFTLGIIIAMFSKPEGTGEEE